MAVRLPSYTILFDVPDVPAAIKKKRYNRNSRSFWCGYDLHLQIYQNFDKQMDMNDVTELVNTICYQYGALTDGNLSDWHKLLLDICELQSAKDDKFELLQQRIDKTCTTIITDRGMTLKANHLLGWVYLSILRDFWDKITYTECKAPKCDRLVPSFGIPTERFLRGRKVNYCGKRCRNAGALYERKLMETAR